ncbi:MAG: L,D-transpeptidase family protein [Hyphomicrobium sp.]|nr:L,D-transpeptidase family protein [Hyphomicrobium sp.]
MAYQTSMARPILFRSRSPAIVMLAAIATLTALVDLAHANKAKPAYETAPRAAGEPVMAIVSIKRQNITFYDSEGWTVRAPVSTGVKGRETPAGVFAILQKNEDHRSNLYDDAHMPHMQRLTWNGIAMHGGPLPGYAASHGCVRLPFNFAEELFDKTRIGMRVIVSPDDATPEDFTHPALLVPDAKTVAEAPARSASLNRDVVDAAKSVDDAKKALKAAEREAEKFKSLLSKAQTLKTKADGELKSFERTLAAATKDNDAARARAEGRKLKAASRLSEAETRLNAAKGDVAAKIEAAAKAKDAARAAADLVVDAARTSDAPEAKKALAKSRKSAEKAQRDVFRAKASLIRAKSVKSKADTEFKSAERTLATAMKAEAKARAEDRKLKAAAKAAQAATRLDNAKAEASLKLEAAAKAKDAAQAAAGKLSDLTKAADEAKLALQPVAIYVSRAKQKLYVRRTTGKPWPDGGEVFDSSIEVPIAVRDPDRPIGTHIFTAMASTDSGLRWSAVTIDSGDNARNALDRISIPQDVLGRIIPRPLLDHHFRRAAEPGDQLPNGVCCGFEQPTARRLQDTPAHGQYPGRKKQAIVWRFQLFQLRLHG